MKPLAEWGFAAGRRTGRNCILTYHGVSDRSRFNSISPTLFERQLEWLGSRYRVVPLAELVSALEAGSKNRTAAAAITFDDGYANFTEHALPLLEQYGFHATLFGPSGKVGSYNDWDEGAGNFVRMPLLGWDDLRALPEERVEIGSHAVTHRRLDIVPGDEAEREVRESRKELEQGTGRPVRFFSYPHGIRPPGRITANGGDPSREYRAVCTTRWGRFNSPKTRYSLRRIGIWDSDTFEDFVDKMSGCYDWLVLKEGIGGFLREFRRLRMPGAQS